MNLNSKLKRLVTFLSLILLTVGMGALLSGCSKSSQKQNTNTITRVNKNGSFIIGKNGTLNANAKVSNKPIIDIYLDPLCPDCGNFDRATSPYLTKQVKSGKILLRYHPLMFLDSSSSDEYSTRASSFIYGVAEYAPKLTQAYISALYEKSFQPNEENYHKTSNAKLTNLFYGVGGTKAQAAQILANRKMFGELSYQTTTNVMKDKSLIKKSPTGELFTPFVIPNKAGKTNGKALLISTKPLPIVKAAVKAIEK